MTLYLRHRKALLLRIPWQVNGVLTLLSACTPVDTNKHFDTNLAMYTSVAKGMYLQVGCEGFNTTSAKDVRKTRKMA